MFGLILFDILNFDNTVIAELSGTGAESYDMVNWKTSDPASGTVVSYTNDGAANTGFVSEQTEPLGQSVALTDPEPPNEPTQYPSSYEQYLFSARESEWECKVSDKFYSGFQGMPDHCRKKRLMDLRIPLVQTFKRDPFKTQPCEESNDPETIRVCTETTRDPADTRFEASFGSSGGEPNLGDNMQAFDDAVQAVRSILNENKGDNSCAKFFGGVGEDALNKIVAMVSEKNFVPLSDAATGINMGVETIGSADLQMPSTGYMTTDPAYVWINTRGPFVNGQAKRIGHQFSATLKSRVLLILHEIGHLVVTGVTRGEVKEKWVEK